MTTDRSPSPTSEPDDDAARSSSAEATTLVVSDVHLGAVPEENERRFLGFLDAVPAAADQLIVVGDLFDFWFEYRTVVLKRHFAVLRALARLAESSVEVRMLGGNHDAWGGSFLREEVGVDWTDGPTEMEIRGRRAVVAHGDGLAEGDLGYRVMKSLVRSRPVRALFRSVHPDLAVRVARTASRTSTREEEGRSGSDRKRARVLSRHADRLLVRRPELDLVVFGHAHRPEAREVEPGRWYLNPGDWIHHFSYGIVTPDRVAVRRWER